MNTRQKPLFIVAGVDEAGRGPLAGPVTAACVALPPNYRNSFITDSKKLNSATREALYPEIKASALAVSCVSIGPRTIDKINIRAATQLAMRLSIRRVAESLQQNVQNDEHPFVLALIDGNMKVNSGHYEETIIKGDEKLLSIGAASIVAKVTRDQLMRSIDEATPGYAFSEHKGYGTRKHLAAIAALGPCAAHRFTFAGVREHLSPLSTAVLLAESAVGAVGTTEILELSFS